MPLVTSDDPQKVTPFLQTQAEQSAPAYQQSPRSPSLVKQLSQEFLRPPSPLTGLKRTFSFNQSDPKQSLPPLGLLEESSFDFVNSAPPNYLYNEKETEFLHSSSLAPQMGESIFVEGKKISCVLFKGIETLYIDGKFLTRKEMKKKIKELWPNLSLQSVTSTLFSLFQQSQKQE